MLHLEHLGPLHHHAVHPLAVVGHGPSPGPGGQGQAGVREGQAGDKIMVSGKYIFEPGPGELGVAPGHVDVLDAEVRLQATAHRVLGAGGEGQ